MAVLNILGMGIAKLRLTQVLTLVNNDLNPYSELMLPTEVQH